MAIALILVACTAALAGEPAAGERPGTPPQSSAASTPVPNPLAVRFREALKVAGPEVAATPEWMRIHAGFVVQDWASMRADAQALAVRFPASADPQIAIAVAIAGTGDLAQAAAALEKAVELQPTHRIALPMLAELQLGLGQFAKAAATLELARKVKPDDLRLLMALGDAYLRSDEPARAVPVLERAIAVAPEDVPAWLGYLDASARAGLVEPARVAFNQLRLAHPGTAATIRHQLPASVLAVVPTPIPPTPRPTPRSDTPRLMMASGPAGGTAGSQGPKVWNEASLGYEAKISDIAAHARPLAEMVERYDLTCQGGSARRPTSAPADAGERSDEGKPVVEIDWKAIWARSAAWTDAAANEPTSECRVLAADILSLANGTRAALEKAVQSTAGSGMSETDRARIQQKYNLLW
jgi:Flp pilus assembly protein TadD